MRTASVFLLLLAIHAVVLFVAPTGAVRTLSEDTSSATPAEPAAVAAADPSAALPASLEKSVAFEMMIAGGICAARTMNMIMSRLLAPIEHEIDDIVLNSARCSTRQGNARVAIRYDLEVDNEKEHIIEDWITKMSDLDAWARSFKEMNNLVKWPKTRDWKVTALKMQVYD